MKSINKMFKYPIIIEKADGNYSAYCPDLLGCIATARTLGETRRLIKGAIELHIEGMKKEGLAIPEPHLKIEYVKEAL